MKQNNLKFYLLTALAVASCFTSSFGVDPPEKSDGRDLMKAIFFRDGNVKLIPLFQSSGKEPMVQNDEYVLIQNNILSRMEKKNPNLFEVFKVNITSGNHLIIRNTLDEYSALLKVTAEEIYGDQWTKALKKKKSKSNIEIMDKTDTQTSSDPIIDNTTAGLFLGTMIYVDEFIYITTQIAYYEPDEAIHMSALEVKLFKDELVNWIASNLAD